MNSINVIGTFGRDVELKFTQGGSAIANGSVAVKRNYAKEGYQDTDWLNVKAIGKNAENMAKYFSKGSKIAITGSYQVDQYEKDGEKKSFGYILVNSWDFVDSKKQDDFGGQDTSDFTSEEVYDPSDNSIPF